MARTHDQCTKVRAAFASADLEAAVERHFALAEEPDAPAVKCADVVTCPEPELEDVASLHEEGALLGEEQREARQVRPAGIDFRFAEVGVHGERRERVCADPLRRVEAHVGVGLRPGHGRGLPGPTGQRWTHAQSATELELRQAAQKASAIDVRDLELSEGRRPAIRFLKRLNPALNVEAPFGQLLPEEKRLEWNANLDRPARGRT